MKVLFTFVTVCSFITASAQDTDKIKELEQRVKILEERMARAEARASMPPRTDHVKKMMQVAQDHAAQERKKFALGDIAKAEELYLKASQDIYADESKKLLESIVSEFPQLNRAGCAQLYRAQQEKGQEKERLLKDCIGRFSGCYYFDGAQVGPLAMLQLAFYYRETGSEDEALKLFKKIRAKHPEAIGHDGALLVDKSR